MVDFDGLFGDCLGSPAVGSGRGPFSLKKRLMRLAHMTDNCLIRQQCQVEIRLKF